MCDCIAHIRAVLLFNNLAINLQIDRLDICRSKNNIQRTKVKSSEFRESRMLKNFGNRVRTQKTYVIDLFELKKTLVQMIDDIFFKGSQCRSCYISCYNISHNLSIISIDSEEKKKFIDIILSNITEIPTRSRHVFSMLSMSSIYVISVSHCIIIGKTFTENAINNFH